MDAQLGLLHRVSGTAANVADIEQTHELLHGEEKKAFADAGCQVVKKRGESIVGAQGLDWHIAAKLYKVPVMTEGLLKEHRQFRVSQSTSAGAGGSPFRVLKIIFRHRKTRYRSLTKITTQLHSLFAVANHLLARRTLLSAARA